MLDEMEEKAIATASKEDEDYVTSVGDSLWESVRGILERQIDTSGDETSDDDEG